MSLNNVQRKLIGQRLRDIINIENRLLKNREYLSKGDVSPFMLALTGRELTLQTKVVQSLQTTMGMSFYEQVAKIIGEANGYKVELQKKVKGHMYEDVEQYINTVTEEMGHKFNRDAELAAIRSLTEKNRNGIKPPAKEFKDSTVDVYIITPDGTEFLIDVTTVKPNKKDTRILKTKTLRWAAYRMSQDTDVKVEPHFAIPYNPEASHIAGTKYSRWSAEYDRRDILVGEEFWRTVSGSNCSIVDIVDIFKEIGEEMGDTIRSAIVSV